MEDDWHLVIIGEGSERDAIEAEIDRLELHDRVHLTGAVKDPARVIGLFDIFALSSDSEQFPLSVVEAMAAGLPVVAPDVGDIKDIVAEENREFITPAGDEGALSAYLRDMARDFARAERIGAANQAKARAEFDRDKMVATYRRLYSSAMRREF